MSDLEGLFEERWPNFEPWEVLSPDGLRAWYDKRAFVLDVDAMNHLQRLRDILGYPVYVNRWSGDLRGYRSPVENLSIKASAEFSRHVFGDAFDISVKELTVSELFDAMDGLGWTGLKEYRTWVHGDWRPVVLGSLYRERL